MERLVRIDRSYLPEAMEPSPRFKSGMSARGVVSACCMGTANRLRLLPGHRINELSLLALSINAFASGMLQQANAFGSSKVMAAMSVRWTLANRESNYSPDLGMALSAFGSWRAARYCKNSWVTGTGFIMLFSIRARLEFSPAAATGR